MRKLWVGAAVAAILVGLYALAGYLVAPSLLRKTLVDRASAAGYQLRFGALATHPFALAVDAQDLDLATRDGKRIFFARRANIDLSASSLWRRAWVVDTARLEQPVLFALPSASGAKSDARSLPPVMVREAIVDNGVVQLANAPRLEDIALRASDLSTVPGHRNAFTITAASDGGSARTSGALSLSPLEATGELQVEGAALALAWRYLPESLGAAPRGRISGSLHYRYADGKLVLSQADVRARLDSGAELALRGELALPKLQGDLQLEAKGVPLALAQPWLAERTQLRIAAGALDAHGTLRLGERARYQGAAAIRDARIDGPQGELLGWQSLATQDLRLEFTPFAAHADEVVARAPSANVTIEPDGRLNLARAFAGRPGGGDGEGTRPAISLGRLAIADGAVHFVDRSLETPFGTTVRGLAGALSGLATAEDAPARVELNGRVGKYGEARVRGTLEPVAPATRTNLELRLRNLALADFTPYIVKFAGYRIESGRLTAALRYRVRDGRLVGTNQLEFDELRLGEKVASAGALDLPIDLAVALLTDAEGRINLAIPVTGDLRDPHFDLGGLIAKALRNTLGNVVSAPFRFLASLFDHDAVADELRHVAFEPGSAAVAPPEEEKLARLAQALGERPQLRLVIHPGYDPQADTEGLKRAAVLRELAQRAGYRTAAAGAGAPVALDLRDDKVRRAAERLYFARGGQAFDLGQLKPREPGYGQRLLRALMEKTALAPEAAAALAERRAQALRDTLVKAGVDAARIELAPATRVQADRDAVPSELALDLSKP